MRNALRRFLILTAALAFAATVPTNADIFLETNPAIQGDVVTSGFENQIEVLSASFGASSAPCGGKGAPISVSEYFFVTQLSSASVDMIDDFRQGTPATSYTFRFTRLIDGAEIVYQELKFNDAQLTSVSQAGSADDTPTESWSITFSSVEIKYRALDLGGKSMGDETVTLTPAACPGS